jgi:hypothetical protein
MSGSVLECHRYYDGKCDGGPCETCEHDALNKQMRTESENVALKIIVLGETLALIMAAVLI